MRHNFRVGKSYIQWDVCIESKCAQHIGTVTSQEVLSNRLLLEKQHSFFAITDTFRGYGSSTEAIIVDDLFFFTLFSHPALLQPLRQSLQKNPQCPSYPAACFVMRCTNVWRYSGNYLKGFRRVPLMNCTCSYVKFSPRTAARLFPCSLWVLCPLKFLIESCFLFMSCFD